MGTLTFVSAKSPAFESGLTVGGHAVRINDLLAELEADTATPAVVIALVKGAYDSLNSAALTLFDQAIGVAKAKGHYTAMADEAMEGAA